MITYIISPTVEQEILLENFLAEANIPFVKDDEDLPDHVLKGIAQGQADFEAGRTVSFDEFKSKLRSNK